MKTKRFKEFVIKASPFNPDLLSGLLWELNIPGLIEESNCIKVFAEKNNLSKKEIESFLKRLKDEKLISEFLIEESELENKNWNKEWEKNLNIIKVTDRIVIKTFFQRIYPERK